MEEWLGPLSINATFIFIYACLPDPALFDFKSLCQFRLHLVAMQERQNLDLQIRHLLIIQPIAYFRHKSAVFYKTQTPKEQLHLEMILVFVWCLLVVAQPSVDMTKDYRVAWSHFGPQPAPKLFQCIDLQTIFGGIQGPLDSGQAGRALWQTCEVRQPRWRCNLAMMTLYHLTIHSGSVNYVYKIIQCASPKVSPSFIDTACTMGNRVSCLQLQAMINSYINNINNINPCWHHLPRCCVTQTLLSCSSRRMKVIGKLSATGANIKSWFKRAGHLKESGGSSLQCLLPTTMTWDSGQSFLFSVNVKRNFIKHNWGMMGISWVISPRTSCPQGTCKPSPAKRCWHRRACFNWSWKRWIQTSLIGQDLWRKPLVYF